MCIYSAPVIEVSGTVIIAGKTTEGKVKIVYSNRLACETGNVMVLPVRTGSRPSGGLSEDGEAVTLVPLDEKYQNLAVEIATGYDLLFGHQHRTLSNGVSQHTNGADSFVPIVQYGPYDVSKTSDLSRVNWQAFGGLLNPTGFYELMERMYPASEHTFIIAKTRDRSTTDEVKTGICYEFVPAEGHPVTLPTFHIHDGLPEGTPDWDHIIVTLNQAPYIPKSEVAVTSTAESTDSGAGPSTSGSTESSSGLSSGLSSGMIGGKRYVTLASFAKKSERAHTNTKLKPWVMVDPRSTQFSQFFPLLQELCQEHYNSSQIYGVIMTKIRKDDHLINTDLVVSYTGY